MELTEAQSIARFRTIAQLHKLGVAMRRAAIRDEHPEFSEVEISRELRKWLGYEGYGDLDDPDLVQRPPRMIGTGRG